MTLGAYIRNVDDAGFLLRRYVHSPGSIAGCPGQQYYNYCSVPDPKEQTLLKKVEDMGVLVRFGVLFFWKLIIFWDRGNRTRPNLTLAETQICTNDHFGGIATDGNANLGIKFAQFHVSCVHLLCKFDRAAGCCIAQRPHASVGQGYQASHGWSR